MTGDEGKDQRVLDTKKGRGRIPFLDRLHNQKT